MPFTSQETSAESATGTTERYVLVVEDDDEIREALRDVLEMESLHVEIAANGKAGLDFLLSRSSAPSVIILDLMMPIMSGWEMLQEMRKDPAMASIPVLISSAVEAGGGLDVAGYLKKPYDLNKLISMVRRFVVDG